MADNEQYLSYDLTKSTTRVVFVCEEVFIAGHHHNILNNRHAATPSSSIALVSVGWHENSRPTDTSRHFDEPWSKKLNPMMSSEPTTADIAEQQRQIETCWPSFRFLFKPIGNQLPGITFNALLPYLLVFRWPLQHAAGLIDWTSASQGLPFWHKHLKFISESNFRSQSQP